MSRPTRARVSAAALRHNAKRARALAPGSRIMACVKADAYGHGLAATGKLLGPEVDGFAVACMEEAVTLREAGLQEPVLLLEGPHARSEIALAAREKLSLCISSAHQLAWLEESALPEPPDCWLKIDTGMHRLGFAPGQVSEALLRLERLGARSSPVLCTHFAAAEDSDDSFTRAQLQTFSESTRGLPGLRSCAASAALFTVPESHADWIRPGYMLYGGSPFGERSPAALELQPAMELSAEVIALREVAAGGRVGYGGRWVARRPSRIATVAAGYGDGYPRNAADGTAVRIGPRRCPLAGRVSMDMITVDVTDAPEVTVGSRAVLWGSDPGIDEVAAGAATIGYELLAGLPARVPRIYAES
ncbi:MAG: alanine racemase [Pseudomonadota bacterium]